MITRILWATALVATTTVPLAARSQDAYFASGTVYDTIRLDFNGCNLENETNRPPAGLGESTASPDNPFMDYRLDVAFTAPSSKDHVRSGFYAADGNGGDSGCTWSVRFTPDEIGDWEFEATLSYGVDCNVDPSLATLEIGTWSGLVQANPTVYGATVAFRKHGPVAPDGAYPYLKHADGTYFLKHGMNSPENFLAYRGFDFTRDFDTSGAFFHQYANHVQHFVTGDPNWTSTSFALPTGGSPGSLLDAGKGISGAIRYLASNHCNGLYFLPLNIGGDGNDTHPFVKAGVTTPSQSTNWVGVYSEVTHYDVGRMRQWSRVMEFAQDLGVFIDLVLFEEEVENIRFLANGDLASQVGDLTDQRKLYLKQMMAYFGHLPGLRFILCEENGRTSMNIGASDREFTALELDDMADLLEGLQSWPTMVTVHEKNNDETPYSQLLSWNGGATLPTWCDSLSMQIGPRPAWGDLAPYFEFIAWKYGGVAHLDEIGHDQYGADPQNGYPLVIRKNYTWDTLLSGGQIAWYNGVSSIAGGDLGIEDFSWFKTPFFDPAWVAIDMLNNFSFWAGVDMDTIHNFGSAWAGIPADTQVQASILSGAATAGGEPEVMWIDDEAFIIYYETAYQGSAFVPGLLNTSCETNPAANWVGQFYDPTNFSGANESGDSFIVPQSAMGTTINIASYLDGTAGKLPPPRTGDVYLVLRQL